MKLIDAKGKRRSITVQKYFAQLFPNLYAWEDLRGKPKPTYTPIKVSDRKRRKYNPKFIKALQQEANYKTWDELCKAYNIPMGSIGYLLKKGNYKGIGNMVLELY